MSTPDQTTAASDHLCVLVHGLWGNPGHLSHLSDSLGEQYPEHRLHILVTKRNKGNFTYDGIETGGERVTQEIEEKIEDLSRQGRNVTKISVIGYSLGGLIARYAIGVLFSKGWFDKIEPVNFTTFATPHVGVRAPGIGYLSKAWNFLGPRTLSISGKQLFLMDKFRDTGRPILSVLADPDTVFMRGLAHFKKRSLYANIINDRTAVYYTTMITKTDPYVDIDALDINYIEGYSPILVDEHHPVSLKSSKLPKNFYSRSRQFLDGLPLVAFFVLILPFGATFFFTNAAIQHIQSARRIRAHESGKTGFDFGLYRIPLMVNEAQHATDRAFSSLQHHAAKADGQYLDAGADVEAKAQSTSSSSSSESEVGSTPNLSRVATVKTQKDGQPVFPTLALDPEQFKMIEHLDAVGFRKFPVHIHKVNHSHAAIIVRMPRKRFSEGKVVVQHWVEDFEI